MKIKPIPLGLPTQIATDLMVRILPFETDATTCDTYYEVSSESGAILAIGNIHISEEQFALWGQDNTYIEDIVLEELGLERLPEITPTV